MPGNCFTLFERARNAARTRAGIFGLMVLLAGLAGAEFGGSSAVAQTPGGAMDAVITGPGVADSLTARLDGSTRERYYADRLALEILGRSPRSQSSFRGRAEGASWRRWVAYEGSSRMSEEEFFRRIGRFEWAQRADAYRSHTVSLLIAGGISVLLGAGAVYGARSSGYGASLQIAGAGLSGLGLTLVGAAFVRDRRRHAPFRVAYDAARQYNRHLLEELQVSR